MLGSRLDTDLVYTCDVYFHMADRGRFSMYDVYNKDSLKHRLVEINGAVNKQEINFFFERGRTNFLLANYKEAYSDAQKVLKIQPSNIVALLIKALCLEIDKKFDEASLLYYHLDKLTGQHAYLVSASISNRKRKEQAK